MGWRKDKYVFRSYVSLTGHTPRTNCVWHSCEMYSRTSLFDGHIQLTTSIENNKHSIRPTVWHQYWRTDMMTWPMTGLPMRTWRVKVLKKSNYIQLTQLVCDQCAVCTVLCKMLRPQGLTAVLYWYEKSEAEFEVLENTFCLSCRERQIFMSVP